MTILQALAGYHKRMADTGKVAPEGYSSQPIDFRLVIDAEGGVIDVVDLRTTQGKRQKRQDLNVPHPQRTSNVMPNFLWDKTAYLFGVTAGDGKRTAREHAEFRDVHLLKLANAVDPALRAFRNFVAAWTPDRFAQAPFTEEMKDKNFVVSLDGELRHVHDTDEAIDLLAGQEARSLGVQTCLVSGEDAPIAELHPVIKNIRGGQSSGGSLVSFNAKAFESWGAEDGANAPTSIRAAAAYGTALNELLRSTANRLQIGDATVVFWADASDMDPQAAATLEQSLGGIFGTTPERAAGREREQDAAEAAKVHAALAQIAAGQAVVLDGVTVTPGTQVHILGLSPNAARVSVRFWLTERLEDLARNLTNHARDCCVEPLPWKSPPSINLLLVRTTAVLEKWDNIPPLLAGEVARAVLQGTPYPRTLLANALMRLHAGDDPATGWHAAVLRGVLVRDRRMHRPDAERHLSGETPVSLAREHPNIGYQLGRLFAVYELAQRAALGTGLNRTIRDSYFSAAMSTPVTVFPSIIANGQNHLGKVRRDKAGWAVLIERELEQISDQLTPGQPTTIPKTLRLEDQAEFAIGYYHQRRAKLVGRKADEQLGFDDEIATPDEDAQ